MLFMEGNIKQKMYPSSVPLGVGPGQGHSLQQMTPIEQPGSYYEAGLPMEQPVQFYASLMKEEHDSQGEGQTQHFLYGRVYRQPLPNQVVLIYSVH